MMPDKLINTLNNFEQWRANKPARNSATGNALTLSGELDEQLVAQLIEAAKS